MNIDRVVATVVAGLALTAHPAVAQRATPEPEADGGGLEEIVITAQRKEESLQRAAIAVSAVSGDMLEAAGVSKPTELTSLVPALQISPAAGPYSLFYLRGVGSFNGNALSDAAVAFNVDGVYIGRPSSTTGFFYDLDRIEVVKGPQGTLYGRNATGGAINVITSRPRLGENSGELAVERGNYNAWRVDASANAALGEDSALRIAAVRVAHDPYLSDRTDAQKDTGARLSYRVRPTENLDVVITGDYFQQRGAGSGVTVQSANAGIASPTALNIDDRIGYLSPQGQAVLASTFAPSMGRTFAPMASLAGNSTPSLSNEYWGVSSSIDWVLPSGSLAIIPSFRKSSLDYINLLAGFRIKQNEDSKQKSLEVRYGSPDEKPLRMLVGAFYYDDNTNVPEVNFLQQASASYQSFETTTKSGALFGRLTYEVKPELRLTLGARETWEKKSFAGNLLSVNRVCLVGICPTAQPIPYFSTPPALANPANPVFISVPFPPFSLPVPTGPAPYGGFVQVTNPTYIQTATTLTANQRENWSKFTWRAGADWDLSPRNFMYASYETGFKAGGFFFSSDNGVYQPEGIRAITLGSKNRFLDNRAQFNVELFRWKYKDQQLSHIGGDSRGVTIFPTENVGGATIQGAEIEARFAVGQHSDLGIDLQYLDAKYDSFVYNQPNFDPTPTTINTFNATSCANASVPTPAVAGVPGNFAVDCSGKRPPNAPKWTLGVDGSQTIPVSFGEFVLNARVHYQTKTLVGLEFLPVEEAQSYWQADASITYNSPSKKYSARAYAQNLFDETVKSFSTPLALSVPGSLYLTALRPPRTYGLRLGVSF